MKINFSTFEFCDSNVEFVLKTINTEGIVLIDLIPTLDFFFNFTKKIGNIFKHPHSLNMEYTTISAKNINNIAKNNKGYSNKGLFLHTDRAGVIYPPNISILICEDNSINGGETILCDGLRLFSYLHDNEPKILKTFIENDVMFLADDGSIVKKKIFSNSADNVISICFRYDEFIKIDEEYNEHFLNLIKIIEQLSFKIKLKKGAGLILNNLRWLHGREAFEGERLFYRILLNSDLIKNGFYYE